MKINAPVPTGEYAVGTFTYTIKNHRQEVMEPAKMRSIACRVYYPVLKNSVENLPKTRYISPRIAQGIKKSFGIAPNFWKLEKSGQNTSECYENAPRIPGQKFPLIVFNHGSNSFREANSFLCIDLASHGYVIISVAHSREAVCAEFDEETDDGSFVFCDKSLAKKIYNPFWRGVFAALKITKAKGTNEELARKFDAFQNKYCSFLQSRLDEWVKDVDASVDYAKKNLSDLIDFEKGIGATGHSFGGNVAYRLCANNPDYVCGTNLDGAYFGDYQNTVMTKSFLQVSGKDNENVVTRVYTNHTKTVYKVLFRDMKHFGFSDMKFLLPAKSMAGKLPAQELHENLCRCHLEFFDAFLKKTKPAPELKSNDAVTVTEFPAN